MTERVTRYPLKQEEGFAGSGFEFLCKVGICRHCLNLPGSACRVVAMLPHEAKK
ncbi:hypothetical protein D3C85_1893470 [compost metagenome]